MILIKPSTFHQMHRRGRSNKKVDRHSGATVFLSPLVEQLTGFRQVTAIKMIQRLFNSYGLIDKINPEENAVKIMEPYDPAEPLSQLIEQLERGR